MRMPVPSVFADQLTCFLLCVAAVYSTMALICYPNRATLTLLAVALLAVRIYPRYREWARRKNDTEERKGG